MYWETYIMIYNDATATQQLWFPWIKLGIVILDWMCVGILLSVPIIANAITYFVRFYGVIDKAKVEFRNTQSTQGEWNEGDNKKFY